MTEYKKTINLYRFDTVKFERVLLENWEITNLIVLGISKKFILSKINGGWQVFEPKTGLPLTTNYGKTKNEALKFAQLNLIKNEAYFYQAINTSIEKGYTADNFTDFLDV